MQLSLIRVFSRLVQIPMCESISLDHFRILAIIDLPETAFMPYASVSSSILILQKTLAPVEQNGVFFAKSSNVGRKSNGDDDYIIHLLAKQV